MAVVFKPFFGEDVMNSISKEINKAIFQFIVCDHFTQTESHGPAAA